ncbi:MAG: hypothetical protein KDK40_04925, partial [Chlamydiia bacterium]|nr:hypothetical protein [Chlamydiia bacterium]
CSDPSQISTESNVNWGAVWEEYSTPNDNNPISQIMRKCLDEQFGSSRGFKSQGGWANISTTKAFTAVMNNKANRDDLLDKLIEGLRFEEIKQILTETGEDKLKIAISNRIKIDKEAFASLIKKMPENDFQNLKPNTTLGLIINKGLKQFPETIILAIQKSDIKQVKDFTTKEEFKNVRDNLPKNKKNEFYESIKNQCIKTFNEDSSKHYKDLLSVLYDEITTNIDRIKSEEDIKNILSKINIPEILSVLHDLATLENKDSYIQFGDKMYLKNDSAQMEELRFKLHLSLLTVGLMSPPYTQNNIDEMKKYEETMTLYNQQVEHRELLVNQHKTLS